MIDRLYPKPKSPPPHINHDHSMKTANLRLRLHCLLRPALVSLLSASLPALALALALALVFAAQAQAATVTTLLNTNFEDGTTQGWTAYQASNPPSLTPTQEKDTGGNVLNTYNQISSSTAFRGVYALLSPSVTLAEGDTITITFRLMFTAATTNVRFGFFKYAGGAQDIEGGTSDDGYNASVSNAGNSISLNRDRDAGNDPTSGSGNAITATTNVTATNAFESNTWYDASFTLTYIAENNMQVAATVGSASVVGTRTSGNYTDFGMFYIGSGNNNARFAIDDVLVTTTATVASNVPEPATTALLVGIGTLALAATKRKRRSAD
ncbi:PEP-CTERM sorting domain-containing protein [Geminisphaera colitermitum]|uniref:PEP-CTERM sorting domain-containing protein n=1 Tax=Geminisphaera colitermitum TaxID=1148786 RepID=UPI000158CEE7|nr:PEP-CTERM sorting domain-containing protein [Geminisphaera colitermitum]